MDIRWQLRLLEQHPGNIGSYLHGPTFYVEGEQGANSSASTQVYYAGNTEQQQSSFYSPTSSSHSTAQAYNVNVDESSVETSSCTSSDHGEEPLDDQQGNFTIEPIHKDDANLGEKLYLAYTRTKKAWRRYTNKPVRKFRRFLKYKGKGRGKQVRQYLATTSDEEVQSFFQKHHKPYYGRSSGKGSRKGKHNNPQG